MIETQFRSGKSNAVTAFSAPWLRQKTEDSDTIIGARAVLNQGLELADVTFFSLDEEGDIVERRDAARAYLRDGYWELHDVRRIRDGNQMPRLETDRVADQSQARIRPGAAGAARNHPVLSNFRRRSRWRAPSACGPTLSPRSSTR